MDRGLKGGSPHMKKVPDFPARAVSLTVLFIKVLVAFFGRPEC